MDVSIILPSRNEERTILSCINKIKSIFQEHNINGEIIVSDSSDDNTYNLIKNFGIKIVRHDKKGYGNAYHEAFKHVNGKNVILIDADNTYDFNEIPMFLNLLKDYDMIIGNRFKGNMAAGSMSLLNKLGNSVLTLIFNLLYRVNVSDAHCGFRAINCEKLKELNLVSQGMEFASEMLIQAKRHKLKIKEIPVAYRPRMGKSKLRPLSDGWRHLRLMLIHAPNYLFLVPGGFMFIIGMFFLTLLAFGPVLIGGFFLDIHPMVLSSLLSILGYQVLFLGIFAKTYAAVHLGQLDWLVDLITRALTIEKASTIGLLLFLIGFLINLFILARWVKTGFGPLSELRTAIFGSTIIILGIQTIFSSFLLSILSLKKTLD